jgi:hypothetical protein
MRYPGGGGLSAAGRARREAVRRRARRCSSRVSALCRWPASCGRLFHLRYTLRGVAYLLHQLGFPAGAGAPGRRAGRGGDRHLAGADLEGTRLAAATGAWIGFENETAPGPAPAQGPHLRCRGCACRRQDSGTGLELRADTMGAMSVVTDRLTAGAPAMNR